MAMSDYEDLQTLRDSSDCETLKKPSPGRFVKATFGMIAIAAVILGSVLFVHNYRNNSPEDTSPFSTRLLQQPKVPTRSPTKPPTKPPTNPPTKGPTKRPTKPPTNAPISPPTKPPTKSPTKPPTRQPANPPTNPPTATNTCRMEQYTVANLADHGTRDSCWVALYGVVFDVTSFINQHPGGANRILAACGTEATEAYSRGPTHDADRLRRAGFSSRIKGRVGSTRGQINVPCSEKDLVAVTP